MTRLKKNTIEPEGWYETQGRVCSLPSGGKVLFYDFEERRINELSYARNKDMVLFLIQAFGELSPVTLKIASVQQRKWLVFSENVDLIVQAVTRWENNG